jgi:hypothetical protein
MNTITKNDAYDAAQLFMDYCYKKTNYSDAAILASDMLLSSYSMPFDSATWADWNKALQKALKNGAASPGADISVLDAYNAMVYFLEIYCSMGAENDFVSLVQDLKNQQSAEYPYALWLKIVDDVVSKNPRNRPYLIYKNE